MLSTSIGWQSKEVLTPFIYIYSHIWEFINVTLNKQCFYAFQNLSKWVWLINIGDKNFSIVLCGCVFSFLLAVIDLKTCQAKFVKTKVAEIFM